MARYLPSVRTFSGRARDRERFIEACLCESWGDGDPTAMHLDQAVAPELAHYLGDGLPGGGDHVRQILVREAHAEDRSRPVGLSEASGEVREQRCQSRRHLPVKEAFDGLIGPSEAPGEGGEQLEGELRAALYGLDDAWLAHHGHPARDHRLGEIVLAPRSPETKLAEDIAAGQQRHRGLPAVAVDL